MPVGNEKVLVVVTSRESTRSGLGSPQLRRPRGAGRADRRAAPAV